MDIIMMNTLLLLMVLMLNYALKFIYDLNYNDCIVSYFKSYFAIYYPFCVACWVRKYSLLLKYHKIMSKFQENETGDDYFDGTDFEF
jgi:hypothetical protein